MKKKNITAIIILISILLITACQKTNQSPLTASMSMKASIDHLNYEEFKDAYAQGEESWISEEEFIEIKSLLTSQTSHKTYELLKFDNGQMILIEFAPIPQNGEYMVQGIKIVPDELKDFFK